MVHIRRAVRGALLSMAAVVLAACAGSTAPQPAPSAGVAVLRPVGLECVRQDTAAAQLGVSRDAEVSVHDVRWRFDGYVEAVGTRQASIPASALYPCVPESRWCINSAHDGTIVSTPGTSWRPGDAGSVNVHFVNDMTKEHVAYFTLFTSKAVLQVDERRLGLCPV